MCLQNCPQSPGENGVSEVLRNLSSDFVKSVYFFALFRLISGQLHLPQKRQKMLLGRSSRRDNEREIQDIYNRQSLTNFALELMQYVNMKRLMSVALVALSFLSGSSQCWTHQGNHRPPSGLRDALAWLGEPVVKQKKHNNTLLFKVQPTDVGAGEIHLKVEINCKEHFSVFPMVRVPFSVQGYLTNWL